MAKRKLLCVTLDDCEIQTFTSGGPGGQHQNRSETGVRIVHKASGAVGTSRENKSQLQNKKAAFRRMAEHPKFMVWLNREIFRLDGKKSAEEMVQADMEPRKLRVEVKQDRKWVPEEKE